VSLSNNVLGKVTVPELFERVDTFKVASGEVFVASQDYRSQLHETTGADAVDMNLFGLVSACNDNRLPLICWRVVSDRADDQASEDFRKFVGTYDGAGGKAVAKVIEALPDDPSSPVTYPNINRALSEPTATGTNEQRRR